MFASSAAKLFLRTIGTFTFILLLQINSLFANGNSFIFEKLSIEQGLSQTTINSILQDSRGFGLQPKMD